MIVSSFHTNHLLTQWANNALVDAGTIERANEEAEIVDDLDKNNLSNLPNTLFYINAVCHKEIREEEKQVKAIDNIAWQAASEINRNQKLANIFVSHLQKKKESLERLSYLETEHPFKIINTLITKIYEIKSDSEKLNSVKFVPEIWHQILFQNAYGEQGITHLTLISKEFDAFIQNIVIAEINHANLNLPDLGFYSMRQISAFFGSEISTLKRISFLFLSQSPTYQFRNKYLWDQHKKEHLHQRNETPSVRKKPRLNIENCIKTNAIEPQNFLNKIESHLTEQKMFEDFIGSLKNIHSFSYCNQRLFKGVHGWYCFTNNSLPMDKELELTPSLFLQFCKNNPKLKELKICDSNTLSDEEIKVGICFLTTLELFDFPLGCLNNSSKNFLDFSMLHSIKELRYMLNSVLDLQALKNFKQIEKVTLYLSTDVYRHHFVRTVTCQIIENLSKGPVKELKIFGRLYPSLNLETQEVPALPHDLKKLTLKGDKINLHALLSTAAKCTSLSVLQLNQCELICSREDVFNEIFKCQKSLLIRFKRCNFKGGYPSSILNLQKMESKTMQIHLSQPLFKDLAVSPYLYIELLEVKKA